MDWRFKWTELLYGGTLLRMITTIEAIYENGVLRLPRPLPLPEKTPVLVSIRSDSDAERSGWLKLSEEVLTATWNNPEDDVFNELLEK